MRIFGLDIGTTSVGFAVVDLDEERNQGRIVNAGGCPGLGVRIFPEARDADGTPLNQQRRAKRMMRRQLRRRRKRRRLLNELLSERGLLPKLGSAEWQLMMEPKKGEPKQMDPYVLRARGLSEALAPHELGRALYHLSKRRHFKERDLAQGEELDTIIDDEEAPKGKQKRRPKQETKPRNEEEEQKQKRERFVVALKASGQTLGQILASRGPSGPPKGGPPAQRKRNEHATRAIVDEEFSRLVEVQKHHHAALRDDAFVGALHEAIFAQRPVFWRESTLGSCSLIPGAPLCPKGSWLSQQRVMLEKLNNLEIAGGNARRLDKEERVAILAKLAAQGSITWPGVRATLEPLFKARGESAKYVKFNLEYGDEKGSLKGNAVERGLMKIFEPDWDSYPHKSELRAFLPEALREADYGKIGGQIGKRRIVIRPEKERATRRAEVAAKLVREFGTSSEQASALAKLHFPQGWEPFSTKALEIMLPELEAGNRFSALLNSPEWEAWRDANFPDRERPTGEFFNELPSPKDRDEQRRLSSLRNPTVIRVQNELRKVVNNLIRVYGKPDRIRIELARQIGLSKAEREERTKRMRANERRREEAQKDLVSKGIPNPLSDDIDKWLLWKECREQCPYTLDKICFDDLFRTGRFEIEHIWPRSISFDDGLRNKTLCRRDINIAKGNRTPFEYFRDKPHQWMLVKENLDALARDKAMSPGKIRRFVAESIKADFTERQLVDTAYAAREAMAMLKRLWPDEGLQSPVNVEAVTGRATAQLRKLWKLNDIGIVGKGGKKTRANHLHHAIDALVVACTHRNDTQQLSHYFEIEGLHRKGLARKPSEADLPTAPWPTIRQDAEATIGKVIVSHRVRKKVSGPLHDEKPVGYAKEDILKNGTTLGVYVKRVDVQTLTLEALKLERPEQITRTVKFVVRDAGVRQVLATHLNAAGGDPKKAYPPYPRMSVEGPEVRKVRVMTTQQKDLMRPALNGFVDPSNNHHIAIYRLSNGDIDFDTVPLWEAITRLSRREPMIRRDRGDGAAFLMSLSPGEAILFPSGDKEGVWIVQGAWANGQVVLTRHTDARPSTLTEAKRLGVDGKREEFLPAPSGIIQRGGRKISVDPIGRVRPAND